MNRVSPLATAALLAALAASPALAQLGRQQGLVDPNIATEAQLTTLPGLTPAIVRSIMQARPFASIVPLDSLLGAAALTAEQRTALYRRMFIHVNLLTGSRAEIVLIPGAGNRMAREFAEYRPYAGGFATFRREIGKYVDTTEVARLEQYVFIPVNLNTASDEDILSIPGAGRRMVREFKEYRPWTSFEQFRREIGKYVDAREVAARTIRTPGDRARARGAARARGRGGEALRGGCGEQGAPRDAGRTAPHRGAVVLLRRRQAVQEGAPRHREDPGETLVRRQAAG
jgi:DNA uptake protein ComE-like DNA-binding protein